MHKKNNIDITKKTHAGKHYATQTTHAHGANTSGTKALGGWNKSRSFNSVYDHAFPWMPCWVLQYTMGNVPKSTHSLMVVLVNDILHL